MAAEKRPRIYAFSNPASASSPFKKLYDGCYSEMPAKGDTCPSDYLGPKQHAARYNSGSTTQRSDQNMSKSSWGFIVAIVCGFVAGVIVRDIAQEHWDKGRISVRLDVPADASMPPSLPPGCKLSKRGTFFCINTGE